MVTVRLLGPFELRRDGRPVALARRPAALLAVLALKVDTPVSYDTLTELVWAPEELPASSRRAIQTYTSRLRDVLGREAVVAHGDGLRLQLDPDRVDLHRFRRLAATSPTSTTTPIAESTRFCQPCTVSRRPRPLIEKFAPRVPPRCRRSARRVPGLVARPR